MNKEFKVLQDKRNQLKNMAISSFSLLYLLISVFWFFFGAYTTTFITFTSSVLLLMVGLFSKKSKYLNLQTNLTLTICFVSLGILMLMSYKSTLLVLIWMFLVPLGSLIFIDRKGVLFWSIAMLLFVISIPFIGPYFPLKAEYTEDQIMLMEYTQIPVILLVEFVMLYVYRDLLFDVLNSLQTKTENLENTTQKLEITQKYKDKFFANISHELRTPMNAIKGISELLESNSEEDQELIRYLKNSSNHLLSIINDLLDYSKMQEGKLTLSSTQFDLRDTIYSSYNIVKVLAQEKKMNYHLTIDSHLPRQVQGDPHRITQILVNILSNAAKFTPEKGIINFICKDITSEEDRTNHICNLKVIINDNGIGMSQEVLKKLYEDYFRSDETKKMDMDGTGLGLTITKNLIDAMKGEIKIESESNKGTEVAVSLKLPIIETIDNVQKDNNTIYELDTKMNILIVDDNHLNTIIAQKQLEGKITKDSKIYTAKNGKIGLEVLRDNDIDVILMDMKMPVMNGIEATRAIRKLDHEKKRRVPIIAMTANVAENVVKECFKSGMDAYISKPFEIYTLTHKIHLLLASRKESENEKKNKNL